MSLNYEDVVVTSNSHKVYLCKLVEDGGEEIHYMQVHDTYNSVKPDVVLYHYEGDSPKEYRKEDILEILHEEEGLDDGEIPVDHAVIKHLYYEDDVYRFSNKDDLTLLYKAMNEPMIAGVWNDDDYINKLDEDIFGLVYYWTEYDDWSCGHAYSYHMKIIFGVK